MNSTKLPVNSYYRFLCMFSSKQLMCTDVKCLMSRTCVEPLPVILWAWQMLAPCVTPRGAALSSKMTAYLQPSPLLTSLVQQSSLLFPTVWSHNHRKKQVHLTSLFPLLAGHVFNMPHDNVKACEDVFGKLQDNHMMSPTLIQINRTSPWSPCSAAIITEFLDSGHGEFQ